MDDVITLVSRTQSQDEFGIWQSILTENEVLCQVHSITRQEFFEAGRSGLNPSYLFTIFAGDYSGESIVRFHNEQYSVYRSYLDQETDYLELYVERKGGTNKIHAQEGSGNGTQ